MDCPNAILILRLASGELPPASRDALRGHVEQCPACSALLAELGETWRTLDAWEVDASGVDLTGRVLEQLEAPLAGPIQPVRWFRLLPEPVRVAASIALAVGLGVGAGRLVPMPQARPAGPAVSAAVSADELADALGLDQLAADSATGLPPTLVEAPAAGEVPPAEGGERS